MTTAGTPPASTTRARVLVGVTGLAVLGAMALPSLPVASRSPGALFVLSNEGGAGPDVTPLRRTAGAHPPAPEQSAKVPNPTCLRTRA